MAYRTVLGLVVSLGVEIGAFGVGIFEARLVFIVRVGEPVNEYHCLEGVGTMVEEGLRLIPLRFYVAVLTYLPRGAVTTRVLQEALNLFLVVQFYRPSVAGLLVCVEDLFAPVRVGMDRFVLPLLEGDNVLD